MGVPKFFRWVAERFPTVITPFKESPPPIDNLYLDMNGIIHNCTHPNDVDATRKSATEKEMVQAMFAYLEKLFAAIQPRKLFYMAIDGCAPRAKMNQQRQRRYRSGYEMMVAREEALKMGEEIPDEADVFDSNCITPGTEFMTRISEHFQYFITMKLQTDSAWQNCKIVFSGHNDPGEGEHKIVDYVRRRKMQPGYDPNETHCMYGLDADLIMLALATHEPHFVLLREVVTFGGAGSKKEQMRKAEDEAKGIKEDGRLAKPDSFVLFHVNLLREFLDMDVRRGEALPNYDLEQVIDDFVFMCFFVGNDFLPSIPTIGINDGSINTMLKIYRDHILVKGSHLLRRGVVNWRSVETLLTRLGELELDTLRARQEEEREAAKREARRSGNEVPINLTPITSMAEYKQRYYTDKHQFRGGWAPRGPEMQGLVQHYIEGLAWVAKYYYQGPPSWKWFYPHHYAPLASDLVNLISVGERVRFDLGEPFLPHQQLLAVLPPMSYRSIPKAYWGLLRSASSPLRQYFPEHLDIDREGARAPWEGIVLIPFIDERVLLAAYDSVQQLVAPEDRARNQQGKPILFQWAPEIVPYTVPNAMFQPLANVRVRRVSFDMPPNVPFVAALCPGVRIGPQHMEGFPSFFQRTPLLSPVFEVGAVNIFGFPSRRESLLLRFEEMQGADSVDDVAFLVGKPVWTNFPHWKRARVANIVDRRKKMKARFDKDGNFQGVESSELTQEEYRTFKKDCEAHMINLKSKLGLVIGHIDVLVYVNRVVGMRTTRKGRLVHSYSQRETCYPLQLVEAESKIDMFPDARNVERERDANDFGEGQQVIYIGTDPKVGVKGEPLLGSVGFVMERTSEDMCTIHLKHHTAPQAIPPSVTEWASGENWMRLEDVCNMLRKRLRLQISSMTLSQISSSIVTSAQFGSHELGLCLKFTAKNLARIGYAKLVQTQQNPWYVGAAHLFQQMSGEETTESPGVPRGPAGGGFSGSNASGRGTWYLSLIANDLITEYCERFRPLVERIERGGANSSQFDMTSAMTGPWVDREVSDVMREITSWLDSKGILRTPMAAATDDTLGELQIRELEQVLESTTPRPIEELRLKKIAVRHLYFPTCRLPEGFVVAVPLPMKDQDFALGKRVVYCRTTGSVPFGGTGTITRLMGDGVTAEVVFDEPFVGGSKLAGRLQTTRGALCKLQALIVLGAPLQTDGGAASPTGATVSTPLTANPARSAPTPAAVMSRGTSITVAEVAGGGGIVLADVERQMKGRSPAAESVHVDPAVMQAAPAARQPSPGAAPMSVPAPRSVQQHLSDQPTRTTPSTAELLKGLTIGGAPRPAQSTVPRAPVSSAAYDLRKNFADCVTEALRARGFN